MGTIWQDLRYGARVLLKNPGFLLVAVLTLGLGIGANAAIFSIAYGVLFRPLPYEDPDTLVRVWRLRPAVSDRGSAVSAEDFLAWREQRQVFREVAAYTARQVDVTFAPGAAEPEEIEAVDASASLFSTLGVPPLVGRWFTAAEEKRGSDAVAMISYQLWQGRFSGAQDILKRSILIQGRPHAIVGVMPPGFRFPVRHDLWLPREFSPPAEAMAGGRRFIIANLNVIARLRPGISARQADAELKAITERLDAERDFRFEGTTVVMGLMESVVGNIRPTLLIFVGAVGFVLLIACANVANLLLARAEAREREVAIRASLGAARGRLLGQLLTESCLLSGLGALLGVGLAYAGVRLFLAYQPGNIPRTEEIQLDAPVLLFIAGLVALTGILCGLAPALRLARADLANSLKVGGTNTGSGFRRSRLRGLLVVGEVGLSLVLLVCAGLLLRSFVGLAITDPGFDPEKLIAVQLRGTGRGADAAAANQLYRDLLERVRALDGVEAAAYASSLPADGRIMKFSFVTSGRDPARPEERTDTLIIEASADYFRAMGIPLRQGRAFTANEVEQRLPVVVVNEAFARRYFPGQNAVGQQLRLGPDPQEIIGVAGNVRQLGLTAEPEPILYQPNVEAVRVMGQMRMVRPMNLLVRTKSDPEPVLAAVRSVVDSLAPDIRTQSVGLMEKSMWESIAEPRFLSLIFALLASVALALAAVGLYGVLAYLVSRRTQEIGVRMALGAQPADVLRLVIRQGLVLAVAGMGLGLAAAWYATRLLTGLLHGVSTTDAATFAGVTALLAGVALLACYVPARRATRVDPVIALRYE